MAHLARAINNAFKRGGLTLQGDAFSALKGFLNDKADVKEELAEALNQVIEQIKAQELSTMLVSVEMINIAISRIQHLQSVENPSRIDFIQVIDAFDTPKYFYNNTRKTFNIVPHQIARHGEAQDKAAIFRDRWNLLYQRLLRNDLFAPPPITKGAAARQSYYQITHIESLVGSPGTKCIFGFLCQVEEGKWYIEDHNSRVRVNISDAKITAGLFTENSIVLAEGSLQDSIFVVVHMGFPPPERRVDTLTAFPLFAPADSTGQRRSQEAQLRERKDDMIIVLSEVYLDSVRVLQKLETLFHGYEGAATPLFVFMGNFTSRPYTPGPGNMVWMRKCFDDLADIIAKFPSLNQSKFVLIPGNTDVTVCGSCCSTLPRPPLANSFTDKLRARVKNIHLATNPCRIIYSGHEMLFVRDNLLHKMRRGCVVAPSYEANIDLSEHLVKTICDQAHLCPLPLTTQPIYWNYDHALSVYPLPHAMILADSADPFEWTYEKCTVFNPSRFSNDFSFVVYRPAEQRVEFSRIEETVE